MIYKTIYEFFDVIFIVLLIIAGIYALAASVLPDIKLKISLKKRYLSILVTIIILFGLYDLYLRTFSGYGFYRGYDLSAIVDSVLGNPEGQYKKIVKVADKTLIKAEDWNKPTCIPMEWKSSSPEGEKVPTKYPSGVAPLKDCVIVYGAPGNYEPYCNYKTRSNCMGVDVYEYILEKPELFKKLMEVVERPCDFIFTHEEYEKKTGEKLDKNSSVYSSINQMRRSMNCDVKDRKSQTMFVTILDKDMKNKYRIVVERKD